MPFFIDGSNRSCLVRTFSNLEEERGSRQAEFPLEGGSGPLLPAPVTLPLDCPLRVLPPLWHHCHPGMGTLRALWCSGTVRFPFLVPPAWSTLCLSWPAPSSPLLSHSTARENSIQNNSSSLGGCERAMNSPGLCSDSTCVKVWAQFPVSVFEGCKWSLIAESWDQRGHSKAVLFVELSVLMNSVCSLQIALNVGYWLVQLFGVFSQFKDKSERRLWQKRMFAWKVLLYSMWKSYDKFNSSWWCCTFLNRFVIFCQNFSSLFRFLKWRRHSLFPNDNFFFSYRIYLDFLFQICCSANRLFSLCTKQSCSR